MDPNHMDQLSPMYPIFYEFCWCVCSILLWTPCGCRFAKASNFHRLQAVVFFFAFLKIVDTGTGKTNTYESEFVEEKNNQFSSDTKQKL